ncbi:unnamed protein product [Rhodiola kirilowii]
MSNAVASGVAGAGAGIIAQIITYPLQTVNTRQQTERVAKKRIGDHGGNAVAKGGTLVQMLQVIKTEGWSGLYSGLKPSLLGTAASQGVYYYFYQLFKNKAVALAASRKLKGHGDGTPGMFSWLAVAAAAGSLNVLLTIPIWVLVTRMQAKEVYDEAGGCGDSGKASSRPSLWLAWVLQGNEHKDSAERIRSLPTFHDEGRAHKGLHLPSEQKQEIFIKRALPPPPPPPSQPPPGPPAVVAGGKGGGGGVTSNITSSRRRAVKAGKHPVRIASDRVDEELRIGDEKMTLLCFVLDLRSLSPTLVRDLKQALLQLANFYAVTSSHNENRKESLSDRIGLCYFVFNRISSSVESKVAYSPRGSFSLRDFHHAVQNLPVDAFCPNTDESGSGCSEMDLSSLLNDQLLYSWGEKDIVKKVIILSSCIIRNINSMREVLAEATEKCVSVEFLLLEQKSGHLFPLSDDMNNFVQQIDDLENCSFNTTLPVSCNLSVATQRIPDDFAPCQTCRCHGRPLDHTLGCKIKKSPTCPVTDSALGVADLIETSVMIGKHTILFLPSFHSCESHRQASQPIEFEIFERTRLASFSEGVIMGAAYYVTPSASHDIESSIDDSDKSDLNSQVFRGLCNALNSLDQGLICSSVYNVETLKEAAFNCYYMLLPSENGPMLLRRIAGSEEILPVNDFDQSIDQTTAKEIEDSIHVSLGKMHLKDYNPVLLERGFHQKLNLLVKESLQFGPAASKSIADTHELKLSPSVPSEVRTPNSVIDLTISADEAPEAGVPFDEEIVENDAQITEWEQLIINEVPKTYSPVICSKSKCAPSAAATDSSRQQDPEHLKNLRTTGDPKADEITYYHHRNMSEKEAPDSISSVQLCYKQ